MNSKVLGEKRAEVLQSMQALREKVLEEKRILTEEEKHQFDSFDREQESLAKEIETHERFEKFDGLSRGQSQNRIREEVLSHQPKTESGLEERNKAFLGWLYHGTKKQKPEYWRAAERQGLEISRPDMNFDWLPWTKADYGYESMSYEDRSRKERAREERSGQAISPSSAGGYTVPVDNTLMTELQIALKFYGNVFQWCDTYDSATGSPAPYPLTDDTGVTGEYIGEGSGPTQGDMTFAQNTLSSYIITSKEVKWSAILEKDSIFNLASLIGRQLGTRLGRKLNTELIAGGTSPITPLLTSVTVGQTTASSPTAIGYADLVALYESVDISYSEDPACGWVFSQNFRAALRGLVDGNQRPLMMSSLEGIALGLPRSLLDKPYYLNQAIPSVASANQCALFGKLDAFKVRRVVGEQEGGINMVILRERYMADNMQIAMFCWGRFDGLLANPGGSNCPIKSLKMHS